MPILLVIAFLAGIIVGVNVQFFGSLILYGIFIGIAVFAAYKIAQTYKQNA